MPARNHFFFLTTQFKQYTTLESTVMTNFVNEIIYYANTNYLLIFQMKFHTCFDILNLLSSRENLRQDTSKEEDAKML